MREIRPYGSVRGVRRKPYPYRDAPTAAASAALFFRMLAQARNQAPPQTAGPPRRAACGSEDYRLMDSRPMAAWDRLAALLWNSAPIRPGRL